MCRYIFDVPLALLLASLMASCSCLHPASCAKRKHPVCDKLCLIKNSYSTRRIRTGTRTWTIYVSERGNGKKGPPVLILHEMPALSAEVLELGLRLREVGYTVYIPLLFGKPEDNPQSKLLGVSRGFAMQFDKDWLAGKAEAQRPIVAEIATLCREYVLPLHQGQRLGVIGMCFTGVIPIGLLGQEKPFRALAAPVVSQPALPLPSCTTGAKKKSGLSPEEMERARASVRACDIQILGFRFEGDEVSPGERFETLSEAFTFHHKSNFLNRSIPKDDYEQDNIPQRAHSVLTQCYVKPPNDATRLPSTEIAWRRLRRFLHAKLDGPVSLPYEEPYPERLPKEQ